MNLGIFITYSRDVYIQSQIAGYFDLVTAWHNQTRTAVIMIRRLKEQAQLLLLIMVENILIFHSVLP